MAVRWTATIGLSATSKQPQMSISISQLRHRTFLPFLLVLIYHLEYSRVAVFFFMFVCHACGFSVSVNRKGARAYHSRAMDTGVYGTKAVLSRFCTMSPAQEPGRKIKTRDSPAHKLSLVSVCSAFGLLTRHKCLTFLYPFFFFSVSSFKRSAASVLLCSR